jgi:hypothetical protein
MIRHLPQSDYLGIKAAFRELVAACGGVHRAASITRGCQSRISEAMSPQHLDRFPAIDQIADLESECGVPVVTRALAAMSGSDLAPVEATPGSRHRLHADLAAVIREVSEVSAATVSALADGSMDEVERAAVLREIRQAVTALHALGADLKPSLREVAR